MLFDTLLWSILRKRCSNFTIHDIEDDYKSGLPDENGTYSGLIGRIQSGELDSAIFIFNPAYIPFEPVYPGPVLFPSDQTLVSVSKEIKPQPIEIIDWFKMLDAISYEYIGFSSWIASVLLTFFHYYDQPFLKLKKKQVASTFCHNAFNSYALTIDQEGFSPINAPQQVLIASYALFLFFLIQSYFKNLLSTDKTVERALPEIDSIHDLLENPAFAEYIPVVPEGLWQMEGLMRALPQTEEGRLWAKIMQNKDESIIKWGTSAKEIIKTTSRLSNFLVGFGHQKHVLIFDQALTVKLKLFLCRIPMDYLTAATDLSSMKLVHVATKTFLPGTLHILLSHHTPDYAKKVFEYAYRNILEFDLFKHKMFQAAYEHYPDLNLLSPVEGMKYAESHPNQMADPEPMTLQDFRKVFIYFVFLIIGSFLILVGEVFAHSSIKTMNDYWIFLQVKRSKRYKSRRKCVEKEEELPIELMIQRLESDEQEIQVVESTLDSEGSVAYSTQDIIYVVEEHVLDSILNREHEKATQRPSHHQDPVAGPSCQGNKQRSVFKSQKKNAVAPDPESERMFIRTNKMPFDVKVIEMPRVEC